MLTKLTIRNFKRFDDVEIPLGDPVVFVGPNNSGKTTALQALALWDLGLRRWKEKRSERGVPEKRPGVTINRRDLLAVPVPAANLLWRSLRTRNVQRNDGKTNTQNVRIDVGVEGRGDNGAWECCLEFDYSNEESLYCRPMRSEENGSASRMVIPEEAYNVRVAYLPPMSGLATNESRLDAGAVNVRLGEGRTAEVLRNLCYAVHQEIDRGERWERLSRDMMDLFHVKLGEPEYVAERGEIQMGYRDAEDNRLDLSSAGRGLQQTLLLLSYLALHENSVLLLDEPDAHLEIIRQREIFLRLLDASSRSGSQLIIASHSEEVLNQAAKVSDDSVVAFLGRPHRIPRGRTDSLKKALREVQAKDYYLAEQAGWVLYLEDFTDLLILRAFSELLDHPASAALALPFMVPIGNQPNTGRGHFDALLETKPDLVGCLIVDNDALGLRDREVLREMQWSRREIENYLCHPETLIAFSIAEAERRSAGPLLTAPGVAASVDAMRDAISAFVPPAALADSSDPFWTRVKASDDFLDRVFREYSRRLGQPLEMRKADYYRLVAFISPEMVDAEIKSALDEISSIYERAAPAARHSVAVGDDTQERDAEGTAEDTM